ncbi:MAG: hypothetical protein PHY90_07290 [Desulfitobacteriaceae bacterium]|nr:hypothetical protein [Desulfitobacteriaceae bacterium]
MLHQFIKGITLKKPLKSLAKVNTLDLIESDAVLFRRGDLWRGNLKTKDGVSYSAYGKGAKPTLCGSPFDAAKEGVWSETEAPNVYMYDRKLRSRNGCLSYRETPIFNLTTFPLRHRTVPTNYPEIEQARYGLTYVLLL